MTLDNLKSNIRREAKQLQPWNPLFEFFPKVPIDSVKIKMEDISKINKISLY